MAQKRIFITRTQTEFKAVEDKIKESGKSNMTAYIRSEICKIKNKLDLCPSLTAPIEGEKIQKVYYISEDSYSTLQRLSIQMKRPISTIFDEFLISPLLK